MQYNQNSLSHHGILGQKWGVRRYQNPDGTWTAEGKARYAEKYGEKSADLEDVKASYKRAKYASAVTNDYQYKYNDARRKGDNEKAKQMRERGTKSAKQEAKVTAEAIKKYDAFCKKYGQMKIKDVDWLTDDGGTRVTMNGRNEVNKILNQSAMKYATVGTIVGGIPVGIAAGYVGSNKDKDRRNAYENELDKIK